MSRGVSHRSSVRTLCIGEDRNRAMRLAPSRRAPFNAAGDGGLRKAMTVAINKKLPGVEPGSFRLRSNHLAANADQSTEDGLE